ncbi:MAG: ATP-dependent Clp protease adaptor ClpS [Gemmataceae bacterium]|nr:ATP-dependent Clp protease adaptor ClpS [Gemmataceae bacterium]
MSDTVTLPELDEEVDQRTKRQPPYHVILLDDDDHTFDYVIRMLKELFAHPEEKGFKMAEEVNRTGRVIVLTTTMEHAELKQEQIHAYGPDPLLERCKGSMTAVIEPAW